MKAPFESLVSLLGALALALPTGCWTSDAHNVPSDAGLLGASQQCGVSEARCTIVAPIPASGEWLDISTTDGGTPPKCAATNVVASYFGSAGFWASPGPDVEAGITNGVTLTLVDSNVCHLKGNVPGSGSWGIYMNPADGDTCDDKGAKTGVVDATGFDGISIQIGGNAGPPGTMIIGLTSFGTPEDPYKTQEIRVEFRVPTAPTTLNFYWSDFFTYCGKREYFNPATILSVGGQMKALAGIAYDYDILLGKISFIHKPN